MTDQGAQPKGNNFVSAEQLAALVDFLEAYPELALGRCNRTTEGRSKAQRLWQECTDILNSVEANCHRKEAKDWRTFYSEYKAKVLKKIKAQKAELSKTGGGKPKEIILTPLQDRLYNLLGRDVGDPLPGVRHNPLEHESEVTYMAIDPSPAIYSGHSSQYVQVREPEPNNNEIVWSFEEPNLEQREQSTSPTNPLTEALLPHVAAATSKRPVRSSQSLLSVDRRPRTVTEQPRRRRRQRLGAESHTQASALDLTEARLTSIEKASADATLEHARATQKLADAVDKLAWQTIWRYYLSRSVMRSENPLQWSPIIVK